MKKTFRMSMNALHTWLGLVLGIVFYFMFVTGTVGYFDTEIDQWMQPEVSSGLNSSQSFPAMTAMAVSRLQQQAPESDSWNIAYPADRNSPYLTISWQTETGRVERFLNAETGEIVPVRETGGGQVLYQMHYRLHYMPTIMAYVLVSICSVFMFVGLVTGIVIHKKIFADFFTFRAGKGARSWLDFHNLSGVLALPFHLMITYSGLLFLSLSFVPFIVGASYGTGDSARSQFLEEAFDNPAEVDKANISAPLTDVPAIVAKAETQWGQGNIRYVWIEYPGDQNAYIEVLASQPPGQINNGREMVFNGVDGELEFTSRPPTSFPRQFTDIILGLHEGLFADTAARWLYFLSGVLGSIMIASGLVVWTTKKRVRADKTGQPTFGLVFMERFNAGTITGVLMAIAVYFWANRLLPLELANRADAEVHALFISWGLALLYPFLRSAKQAWLELLWASAMLYLLLPLVSVLTTERHFIYNVIRDDWPLIGVELSQLVMGMMLAMTAIKLQRRWRSARQEEAPQSTAFSSTSLRS